MTQKSTHKPSKNILKIENLKHSYNDLAGKTDVLKGVDATFESGKLYAIIGESGSGKTTLLSLLAGLDKVQAGDIAYNHKSVKKIGGDRWRLKYVNVVFQSYNLIKYMTARENVEVALDFAGKDRDEKAKAYAALEKVGLKREEADRLVLRLSGGQQQRVAIARALASDVPIVFADEPTGNLDEKTEAKILELFRELAVENNKIVVIVTHSQKVAEHADANVLQMEGGLLVPKKRKR
jgi:putative ABC transport system ATP-binding protein